MKVKLKPFWQLALDYPVYGSIFLIDFLLVVFFPDWAKHGSTMVVEAITAGLLVYVSFVLGMKHALRKDEEAAKNEELPPA